MMTRLKQKLDLALALSIARVVNFELFDTHKTFNNGDIALNQTYDATRNFNIP
jgi:hypothetical protein